MIKQKLAINPIVVKEVRSRMRGWRAFGLLTLYLVFLALFSYGIYRVTANNAFFGGGMPLSPMIGQALFVTITNLSLFFVAFLTPALTAGAISSEHEKLTLEMLQATPLSPHTILLGKLISTVGYLLLLLLAAIPIVSLVFTFGGVAPIDLLWAALVILATGLTFGTIGLFFSAWRKRTMQAIGLSYLTVLVLVGGTFAGFIFWGMMIQNLPPPFILIVNPFSALGSIFVGGQYQAGPLGIFGIMAGIQPFQPDSPVAQLRPLWYYTLAFDLIVATALYLLATRLIKPVRPWRIGWRGAVVVLLIVVLYGGIGSAVFYQDAAQVRTWIIEGTPTPTPFPGRFGPVPTMIERAVPVPPPPIEVEPTPLRPEPPPESE